MALKHQLIGAGFAAFRGSGLHKAIGAATRGTGVILTLHHVRPWRPATPGFAPNRLLEITPEFLDEALGVVRATVGDPTSAGSREFDLARSRLPLRGDDPSGHAVPPARAPSPRCRAFR